MTFTSASFASIKAIFVLAAPASVRLANVSLTPAAEKSTVEASVASAIAAPSAAVAASLTVIVNVLVPASATEEFKEDSCAAVPLIDADSVPPSAAVSVFRVVTPALPDKASEMARVPLFDKVFPAKASAWVDVSVNVLVAATVKLP